MRSADRCKEHHQGDRCRKARGHDSELMATPDPIHVGMFAAWDRKQVLARYERVAKLPRSQRRALRALCLPQAHVADRRRAIDWLDNIVRFLKRLLKRLLKRPKPETAAVRP